MAIVYIIIGMLGFITGGILWMEVSHLAGIIAWVVTFVVIIMIAFRGAGIGDLVEGAFHFFT
jgi:hypothetical protein